MKLLPCFLLAIVGPVCIEAQEGSCSQGIDCPATGASRLCSPDECGPAPGAPSVLCPDGSVSGPACLRDGEGACGWQWSECDGGFSGKTCARSSCPSPAPGAPNYLCEDGVTVAGPACEALAEGTCGWVSRDCPP